MFSSLLERKIPAILVLAEAMHEQWSEPVSEALGSGRLLIITHCGPEVHTVCARSAFDRNALMMALADEIVVGYCSKGGNLERGLAGYSNVRYLVGNQANRAKTKELLPQQGGRSYAGRRFPDDSHREKAVCRADVRITDVVFLQIRMLPMDSVKVAGPWPDRLIMA